MSMNCEVSNNVGYIKEVRLGAGVRRQTVDIQSLKNMLEQAHYEVIEVWSRCGSTWLSFRVDRDPDSFVMYLSTHPRDNYLSLHTAAASLKLDQEWGASVAAMLPEINYRNKIARVGIDSATGDLVVVADVYLADLEPSAAFVSSLIREVGFFASCACDIVRASQEHAQTQLQ